MVIKDSLILLLEDYVYSIGKCYFFNLKMIQVFHTYIVTKSLLASKKSKPLNDRHAYSTCTYNDVLFMVACTQPCTSITMLLILPT